MRPDERGQTTVLIVGLAVVLLMAVGVVVDATAAYLQRQALLTLADGASLAGADAGSRHEAALYGEGLGSRTSLELQRRLAYEAVADHLRRTGAPRAYPGLTWQVRLDPSGERVVVELRAPLDLPLTVPGSPRSAVIGATGSALVRLDR